MSQRPQRSRHSKLTSLKAQSHLGPVILNSMSYLLERYKGSIARRQRQNELCESFYLPYDVVKHQADHATPLSTLLREKPLCHLHPSPVAAYAAPSNSKSRRCSPYFAIATAPAARKRAGPRMRPRLPCRDDDSRRKIKNAGAKKGPRSGMTAARQIDYFVNAISPAVKPRLSAIPVDFAFSVKITPLSF